MPDLIQRRLKNSFYFQALQRNTAIQSASIQKDYAMNNFMRYWLLNHVKTKLAEEISHVTRIEINAEYGDAMLDVWFIQKNGRECAAHVWIHHITQMPYYEW